MADYQVRRNGEVLAEQFPVHDTDTLEAIVYKMRREKIWNGEILGFTKEKKEYGFCLYVNDQPFQFVDCSAIATHDGTPPDPALLQAAL